MGMFDEEDNAGNAMLMFQKGLGSFAQADHQQKELALNQMKAKFDQMNKEKDDYAAIFGNKEFSPQYRMQAYNSMVAIDKVVNPASKLMPMDSWDAVSENLSKDIGAARKMLVEGTIDRKAYNKMVMGATATAYQAAQSKDEVTSIDQIEKAALSSVQGSTATARVGDKIIEGRENPLTTQIEPFETTEGPAISPNVQVQTMEKVLGPGGYREQELGVKKQNADNTAALLGQRIDQMEVSTAKTLLDALNSSDKAKAGAALKQWIVGNDPTNLSSMFIDENKLMNEITRGKVRERLAAKVGVQPGAKPTPSVSPKPSAAPEAGTLEWNGKSLKDTPANRKWLEEQKKKQK